MGHINIGIARPCRKHVVDIAKCHDSSRVSAMPTSRAYDTRYAIHPNMLTHDLHGPHAVIINMDLRVHGHVLYKRRHACSTTTNGCLRTAFDNADVDGDDQLELGSWFDMVLRRDGRAW